MGEGGAANEAASAADIEAMTAIVANGITAGALGFSTSPTLAHRAIDGEPVPGTFALNQNNADPSSWRRLLDFAGEARKAGVPVRPQVHGRTVSLLLGFQTFHPLAFTPTWAEAGLGLLDWPDQVARLRAEPELVDRIVADAAGLVDDPFVSGFMHPDRIYVLGDPPVYEPGPDRNVSAMAAARGVDRWRLLLDLLLSDDGRELVNAPVLNYSDGNLDAVGEMLTHVIDFHGLAARRPELAHDLPGGASRLVQRADGYLATVKSGAVTFGGGEDTGARRGSLLRGAR